MRAGPLVSATAVALMGCQLVLTDYQEGDARGDAARSSDGSGSGASSSGGSTGSGGSSGGISSSSSSGASGSSSGTTCAGAMQSGTALCEQVLAALCMRRVYCQGTASYCACPDCAQANTEPGCVSSCSTSTPPCSQQTCTSAMSTEPAPKGYDCSQPSFANRMVCSSVVDPCTGDVMQIACTDSIQNTWNWPTSCQAFWSLFP